MARTVSPLVLATALLLSLTACKTATNLLYEPPPDDPLDGYKGILSQAGVNTEMDWGPQQNLLLSEFTALRDAHAELQKLTEDLRAENANLKTQLGGEASALQKEKALRAQSEAETELLRQRVREREARLLSLSIEKAKLEQQALQARIDALRTELEPAGQNAVEAAATPPPRRL
jgi:hypothetical protein